MADNVIHGTGKPRFVLPTEDLLSKVGEGLPEIGTTGYYDVVASSTTTTVVLTNIESAEITQLDESYGLKGIGVWTKQTDGTDTWGVIQSFVAGTKTFTVESWSNGNPVASAYVQLKGRYIDLPNCQRLTESFTPDFIVKKMLNGNIITIKRGFYYSASLDYARYLHKDEMEIIRYLFQKSMNGCGFFPRRDNTAILYTIDIDPESAISFYQLQNHQGHGGVVINITGITRVANIQFSDPTVLVANAISDSTDAYVTDDLGQFPTAD